MARNTANTETTETPNQPKRKFGVNTKNIQDKMDQIFIPKDIYILGETYSERQAWIEGAIETVHKKLSI